MNEIVCSGALFYAINTKRFLFLHRATGKQNNVWGLVGGTNENTETPLEALQREITEEIGNVNVKKIIPLETFISNDNHFLFYTFLNIVSKEFTPDLNHEHNGYAWVSLGCWPNPLHHGLKNTLRNKINQAKLETIIKLITLTDMYE